MKIEDVKEGMKLKVVRRFPPDQWPNWNKMMDQTIGLVGEVSRIFTAKEYPRDTVRLRFPNGKSWVYQSLSLEPIASNNKFKKGDLVVVYRKVKKVPWVDGMNHIVGLRGIVLTEDNDAPEIALESKERFFIPYTALKRYKD